MFLALGGQGPATTVISVFHHADLDGLLLVITHLDLEGLRRDALGTVLGIVRHAMLTGEVEAIAGKHPDDLVLRGVVDLVLAHELELTIAILRVEADLALGQGDAELVGLGVLELTIDLHLAGRRDAPTIMLGAFVDVDALGLDARGAHELDLLGLLVPQGRRIAQRVEVELVEGLLRDDGVGHLRRGGHGHGRPHGAAIVFDDAVHVARHQLDLGVGEGHPALVVHRHPAHDVEEVALVGGDEVVAGLPGEAVAQVGDLGVDLARGCGVELPVQGRLQDIVRT